MDTFMKIKEMASKVTKECFTKDQCIIIIGGERGTDNIFGFTSGDFCGIMATLAIYIERLSEDTPMGISKFDILNIIRALYAEDET